MDPGQETESQHEPMATTVTRFPSWLLARIDVVAERASESSGERITRSAVIRSLLADGLIEMELALGVPQGREGAW